MICTNDQDLYERMKSIYYHGMDKTKYERGVMDYSIKKIGYKYNMSDIQAAIGRVQLSRMKELKERRQEIALAYIEAFKDTNLKCRAFTDSHSWHLFMIECTSIEQAGIIQGELTRKEIGFGKWVSPLSGWSCVSEQANFDKNTHDSDFDKYFRTICLPIYFDLKDEEQKEIIEIIKNII